MERPSPIEFEVAVIRIEACSAYLASLRFLPVHSAVVNDAKTPRSRPSPLPSSLARLRREVLIIEA